MDIAIIIIIIGFGLVLMGLISLAGLALWLYADKESKEDEKDLPF